jgi:hypothetical protein
MYFILRKIIYPVKVSSYFPDNTDNEKFIRRSPGRAPETPPGEIRLLKEISENL